MSCEEYSILISEYADGESRAGKDKIESHIAVCASCRAKLESIRASGEIFRAAGVVSPPEFFETRLFARIKEKKTARLRLRALRRVFVAASAFIALAAVYLSSPFSPSRVMPAASASPPLSLTTSVEDRNFEDELLKIYYEAPVTAKNGDAGSEKEDV